jgi:hypothetical protein
MLYWILFLALVRPYLCRQNEKKLIGVKLFLNITNGKRQLKPVELYLLNLK